MISNILEGDHGFGVVQNNSSSRDIENTSVCVEVILF